MTMAELTQTAKKLTTAPYRCASLSKFREAASPHQQLEYINATVGLPTPTILLNDSASSFDTSMN